MIVADRDPNIRDLGAQFRNDVLAGLSQRQKVIPARWIYDWKGSELFEAITDLREYYPTRTEIGILRSCLGDVAERVGPGRVVVEPGAGSVVKTPLLLEAVAPSAFVPVDISGDFLRDASDGLRRQFPGLPILPVEADFSHPFALPPKAGEAPRLGFFPGSTIGNMEPWAASDLLRSLRHALGDDAMLLIGMDLIKERDRLIAAYDDAKGVTAAFNLNLAARVNRELDGTLPLDALAHRAVWNAARARIEMHLVARQSIAFEVSGRRFSMEA
ncbi:MAG: L-histidine N(alpha)-methyltransferase, partial [Alphaproteobacteria bacterium]|nr:L-histidine N(alpha)-methyltransferase [Alphaproteobacteria bacterium]